MKIKGVIEDLKIKKNLKIYKMIIVKYIYDFLWSYCGQYEVSSFSDSSLVQLVLLKIYRPLPM